MRKPDRRRRGLLATMSAGLMLPALIASCRDRSASGPEPEDGQSSAVGREDKVLLNISGSSTMGPLISALAGSFEALYPQVRVAVTTGGTSRGIGNVRSGASDIGMVSRNLADSEQDLRSFPIARDGVGLVVPSSNPIRGMTSEQLRGVYTGQIRNWNGVGGIDAPITAISREKGRSALELLLQYLNLNAAELHADQTVGENAAAFEAILADGSAIAFISVGESARNIAAGMSIKLLEIDGTAPTPATLANGNYPVVRPLTLITRTMPQGAVKQFIDFCLSSQATEQVRKFDFIPYLD